MSDDNNSNPAEVNSHRDKRFKSMESQPTSGEDDYFKEVDRRINDDAKIRALRTPYPHDLNEALCSLLLSTIVKHSSGRLYSDYRDDSKAEELVDEREDLKQELLKAWRDESYKNILKLGYLQAGPFRPHSGQLESVPSNATSVLAAVEHAWKIPYEGTHHELLFRNINAMIGTEPYTNICAIVQSSGTGKSRMVHEQAELVYTLPINIRGDPGSSLAYPPRDDALFDYFKNTSGDQGTCKLRYMEFFRSLFHHAAEELHQFANHPRKSQAGFATIWRERMEESSYRNDLYRRVVQSCEEPLPNETSFRHLTSKAQEAEKVFDRLVKGLEERCEFSDKIKIKVVVYVDEAHELRHIYPKGGEDEVPRMQLDLLCSVLTFFGGRPLFCLLLSTQSSLRFLAPTPDVVASARASEAAGKLLAPITETPFDCAPDIKISPGTLRLGDLVDVKYLAKWGRPLWWTMLKKGNPGPGDPLTKLINLARVKLLRRHKLDIPFKEIVSHSELIAVTDIILAFDFEPCRETLARRLGEMTANEADMVANHMRIAYSVPQHREYLRSGYSSEPILAEAAAQQIHQYQSAGEKDSFDAMVEILKLILEPSQIALGERGELIMRLLLTRAYMDAVVAERTPEMPLIFSRGCSLIGFINQLFTSEKAKLVLACKPDNLPVETTLEDGFRNAAVRFTHFVKAGDASALRTGALFAAFARGMAFICQQNQAYVDIVIPVLLDKSFTLRESAMSAILIQVKRQVDAKSGLTYAFFEHDVGLFPDSDDEESVSRPYFVLITELGHLLNQGGWDPGNDGKEQEKGKGKAKGKAMQKGNVPPELFVSRQPQVQHDPNHTHPRFLVTAYGCSNELYKAVEKNLAGYQQLSGIRDALDDHPRQDGESRSAVMEMKPIWKFGPDSYHWVDDEALNTVQVE